MVWRTDEWSWQLRAHLLARVNDAKIAEDYLNVNRLVAGNGLKRIGEDIPGSPIIGAGICDLLK